MTRIRREFDDARSARNYLRGAGILPGDGQLLRDGFTVLEQDGQAGQSGAVDHDMRFVVDGNTVTVVGGEGPYVIWTDTGVLSNPFTLPSLKQIFARDRSGRTIGSWFPFVPLDPSTVVGVRIRVSNIPMIRSPYPAEMTEILEGFEAQISLVPSGPYQMSGSYQEGTGGPGDPLRAIQVLMGKTLAVHAYEGSPWSDGWVYPYSTDGHGLSVQIQSAVYPWGGVSIHTLSALGVDQFVGSMIGEVAPHAAIRGDLVGWGTSSEYPQFTTEILGWITT